MTMDNRDVSTIHQPVLLEDCVRLVTGGLSRKQSPIIVDCTLGLAGHATAFLKAAPQARLVGIDRDAEALALATERMKAEGLADRFIPVHAPFDEFTRALDDNGSYSHDAPLDMRMDVSQALTAEQVLAEYDERDLARIFKVYGEERFARPIARRIVARRTQEGPLTTSAELNELVDEVIPKAHRPAGNPAKRVFQALRIEVNGELDKLAGTLPQIALKLNKGGRIVVESYHSLEDKTVKSFMAQGLTARVPANMPIVPPEAMPFFKELTRGAVKADEQEIASNPRSASVRLRAVELTRPLPEDIRHQFVERVALPGKALRARHAQGKGI